MLSNLHQMTLSERIAYHEAGHATAALQFGIPIIAVSIATLPHRTCTVATTA